MVHPIGKPRFDERESDGSDLAVISVVKAIGYRHLVPTVQVLKVPGGRTVVQNLHLDLRLSADQEAVVEVEVDVRIVAGQVGSAGQVVVPVVGPA